MSDTDRLYALSSTYDGPWLYDVDGPGLLINDAVLAMHWYLAHEREETLTVTGHVSDDDGATWQPLAPDQLLADAERSLAAQQLSESTARPGPAGLLGRALDAEAAEWLDHRIRFVQPDDPNQRLPETPSLASWQRGGQIWAIALGTVPHDDVLTHLAARYTDPQPEGPDRLRAAAHTTLRHLAVAEDPRGAGPAELLGAWRHLDRLTFSFGFGQVNGRAKTAQRLLMDHLVARHRDTAPVVAEHPDPQHPAHQAARAYLQRLSQIEAAGEESLRADIRAAFDDALREAATGPDTAPAAPAARPGEQERQAPAAIPGYPRPLLDDRQAAAAWRLVSPVARRDAEQAMADLADATRRLAEATAHRAPGERPTSSERAQESAAVAWRTRCEKQLAELDARHAVLMHASVLADAEAAATPARHNLIIAAQNDTERALPGQPHSLQAHLQAHEAFMAQVNAGEDQIAATLATQRQLTRDAMHRLFPTRAGQPGLHALRTELIEYSGLGFDHFTRAYRAIGETSQRLTDLEATHRSQRRELHFGEQPVTEEQLERARTSAEEAEPRFEALRTSRSVTLRAVKVLDGVAGLAPSTPDGLAARAALIGAQSRERALQPQLLAAEPVRGGIDQHPHRVHQQSGSQAARRP